MNFSQQELQEIVKTTQLSSDGLKSLLKARDEKKINFKLVDIREEYEYTDNSINGVDLLIPTSVIGNHVDIFEKLKDENVILYCRTGNRTAQVMHALHNMGLKNITHLSRGIMPYTGETRHGAKLPNKL
jgi:rhodanese-related sulfurtransferase